MIDLGQLRSATPVEAERIFADVPAEELVAAVGSVDDDTLLELIGREEIRPVAVRGILSRLHEYAVPERLAEISGRVRFVLDRRGKVLEEHTLVCDAGSLTLEDPEHGKSAEPDVVLRTSVLRFVRLISGERNAGLEYLSGKLDIEGDAALALAVGGLFRVPGSDAVAVDPTALDPVDVATALGQVKRDHLAKVMHSGFRAVVLSEIFRRLPDYVDAKKAAKTDLTIGFRLTGNPSGEVERYVVVLAGGAATVTEGEAGGERDATVICEAHDFLRLATGHLNPVVGVLRGQLKVKGDQAKALQLSSVIDIPQAR